MWHQWFNHKFMKLREYFLCAKKTQITTLFNHFFSSVSVFEAHSQEYHDTCVWCCWHKSRRSDKEHPSLLVHRLYILVQKSIGWAKKVTLSVEIFRQVYEDSFMYSVHNLLLLNKVQRIQVLRQNAEETLICVPKMNKGLAGLEQHEGV